MLLILALVTTSILVETYMVTLDPQKSSYIETENILDENDLENTGDLVSEDHGDQNIAAGYYKKMEKLPKSPQLLRIASREIKNYEYSAFSTEGNEVRKYLDWFFSIPWGKTSETSIDIPEVRKILDRDHQGMDKIKEHILEYLAVQKRVPNGRAPILCFAGPPGVGKTTLAKSIAEATGRKFVKISMGGVNDEANIRGFQRTYIGSRPGEIVRAIKEAGVFNPVILLDEIDKLSGSNYRGDPASALLEVLDPAQNNDFKDHYLEVGMDLSKVMFIATANNLENVPLPLLDRLEIIELASYTPEEKMNIATKSLIPKQIKDNGLADNEFSIDDQALREIIDQYTLEAGVRQLNRTIGLLSRKAVKEIADGKTKQLIITPENLEKYLGIPALLKDKPLGKDSVGIAQGLAWSPVGGGVMPFEAVILPGDGKIIKTGNLGELSQESIEAALTSAQSVLPNYSIDQRFLHDKNIHIHVATATKKDGPSAGITITTAIVSAITKIPVRKDVCMTGEINIHGDVLPIGGLKEKLIAAHRLGLKIAIIPEANAMNLVDVPDQVKKDMKIIPVRSIEEVLKIALVDQAKDAVMPQKTQPLGKQRVVTR